VRQLRSTIRRAVLLTDDGIKTDHLDIVHAANGFASCSIRQLEEKPKDRNGTILASFPTAERFSLREIVAKSANVVEREAIMQALLRHLGNKAKAARTLKIDYKTMQTKVKKYHISFHQNGAHEKDEQK
jgi:DNA-binding NtrC family response regulator